MRRVVITGMGIWSCLGTDIETVTQSLRDGKSGIGIEQQRLDYGYRSGLTGIVEKPVITKQMLDRHTRAGMSEEAQYAYMASRQAFAQAMIDDEYLLHNEVGCIFGNDSSAKPVIETSKIMDEKHDTALLGYGLIFQSMNSTVNMNLSTIFHLRGVNFTIRNELERDMDPNGRRVLAYYQYYIMKNPELADKTIREAEAALTNEESLIFSKAELDLERKLIRQLRVNMAYGH